MQAYVFITLRKQQCSLPVKNEGNLLPGAYRMGTAEVRSSQNFTMQKDCLHAVH